MAELERLKEVFSDRSEDDLCAILSRYEGDLEAAVEAIIACSSDEPSVALPAFPLGVSPTTVQLPPQPCAVPNRKGEGSDPSTAPCNPNSTLTIKGHYPSSDRDLRNGDFFATITTDGRETNDDDGGGLDDDMAQALRASTAPSDQGRLVGMFGQDATPADVIDLLHDPTFVSTLDDGLRAALFLQMQIDAEERSAALASGDAVSPFSMAPPIPDTTKTTTKKETQTTTTKTTKTTTEESSPADLGTSGSSPLVAKLISALHVSTNLEESVRAARSHLVRAVGPTSSRIMDCGLAVAASAAAAAAAATTKTMAAATSSINATGPKGRGCANENDDGLNAEHKQQQKQQQQQQQQQQHAEAERQREEATEACLREARNHLLDFLSKHPDASYAEWIEALHPENVPDGQLLDGVARTVDHRFYVEESDHRRLWNENLTTGEGHRTYVPSRALSSPVDLLGGEINGNDSERKHMNLKGELKAVMGVDDLISFD